MLLLHSFDCILWVNVIFLQAVTVNCVAHRREHKVQLNGRVDVMLRLAAQMNMRYT